MTETGVPSNEAMSIAQRMENRQAGKLYKHFSTTRDKNQSIALKWKNIKYSLAVKNDEKSKPFRPVYTVKHVLSDVSGEAVSGELLAIMGPTGCGKTSLLNVLAARVSAATSSFAKLEGTVEVNGEARNDDSFRKVASYVLQDDRLFAHLTVFETLTLAAHFYLPYSVTEQDKVELVESVMEELGLMKTRDTIIGDEKVRGVSGGERKRANIAVQLISDPAVLFLDEPTSGLDSFQALAIMDSMKAMALNGRLVVSVIHQPRSSIYDMFDKLLLLSEGRTIYLGDAHAAQGYFKEAGFSSPKFFNPADFFLDLLSPDHRTSESTARTMSTINTLACRWIEVEKKGSAAPSDVTAVAVAGGENAHSAIVNEGGATDGDFKEQLQKSFRNFYLLSWRANKEQSRAWHATAIKIITSIFFGLVIGGIYSDMEKDQAGIRSREGVLFVIVLNQAFNASSGVYNSFPKEKVVTNRERAGNAYSTFSYFVSKFIAEFPLNVLPALIFGTIVYWVAGLNPDRFGTFFGVLILEICAALGLGLAISAAVPTVEAASALGIPFVVVPLLFGGFYINLDSLDAGAAWIPYISFIKWAFQALMINEFEGETFSCKGGVTSQCLKTGNDVLRSLSLDGHTVEYASFGLAMMFLGYMLVSLLILYRNRPTYLTQQSLGRTYKDKITAEIEENSFSYKFHCSSKGDCADPP